MIHEFRAINRDPALGDAPDFSRLQIAYGVVTLNLAHSLLEIGRRSYPHSQLVLEQRPAGTTEAWERVG